MDRDWGEDPRKLERDAVGSLDDGEIEGAEREDGMVVDRERVSDRGGSWEGDRGIDSVDDGEVEGLDRKQVDREADGEIKGLDIIVGSFECT
jgi:hypothetical protein